MKILALCLLLCAAVAQSSADEAGKQNLEKRSVNCLPGWSWHYNRCYKMWGHCPSGWHWYAGRCFQYFRISKTWAAAEKYCQANGGNLASIRNIGDYRFVQNLIYAKARYYPDTWIGGFSVQERGDWLWSDGARFTYSYWCGGQPNSGANSRCLEMNVSSSRCWRVYRCTYSQTFVCARNIW